MANNCFYMMHIKGDKNAIDEFVGMMKNGKMGRFFSVEAEMDSDHEAIVSERRSETRHRRPCRYCG